MAVPALPRTLLLALGLLSAPLARAQSRVPDRQVPPSVFAELASLEARFDVALAADCDAERCFSRGCTYVDHAVADRPRARSLPGLAADPGPGAGPVQEYLTRATCSFAYEESIEAKDVQALSRRLQAKLSKGWTVVTVDQERLSPLPPYVGQTPVEEPPPVEEPVVEPPPVERPPPITWVRELWTTLLPHLFWMIGVGLVTLAAAVLIWAWRRLGADTIEDRMLLAELGRPPEPTPPPGPAEEPPKDDFVETQQRLWSERLGAVGDPPDPAVQALVRELLRTRDLPLLASAVLRFPDRLPAAFPEGGDLAAAKLELAEHLKGVDDSTLPADADFFRQLNRHALAASVASQGDADVVRSLREEFGASGIAALIGRLDDRTGALLFALSPADEQGEIVSLLPASDASDVAGSLLRSNRMSPDETRHLFAVVEAARTGRPLPESRGSGAVDDLGVEYGAAAALSVLLEHLDPARRAALFDAALQRSGGTLPSWTRDILVADWLLALPDESRADLLLDVEVQSLAAWTSLLGAASRERVLGAMPSSLRTSVRASTGFASRARQVALAQQGRRDLARGFQQQLVRAGVPFERVVRAGETA